MQTFVPGCECTLFEAHMRPFPFCRAVPHEAFTGAHTDSVYMSRGTEDLVRCVAPTCFASRLIGSRSTQHSLPPVWYKCVGNALFVAKATCTIQ